MISNLLSSPTNPQIYEKKSELLYYNDENLMDAVGLAVEDEAVGEIMIDHCVAY